MGKKTKQKLSTALKKRDSAKQLEPKDDREALLIRNLYIYDSVREAGIQAGYSKSYVNCGQYYRKLNSDSFQAKLLAYAKAHNTLSLPQILDLEDRAIRYLASKTEEEILKQLPKLRHTLKERKQISGLLRSEDDGKGQSITINIEKLQALMREGHEIRKAELRQVEPVTEKAEKK